MLSLIPLAMAVRLVDDVVSNWAPIRRTQKYLLAQISSNLVITPEELEIWNSPDTDVETRVAIYKRGLLRHNIAQKTEAA